MPKRNIAATLLLTFTVASCRTWTPMETVPDPMPEEVRVELLSGEQVEVSETRMEADTLVGRVVGGTNSIRVPVDQIAYIEEGRLSWARTALVVLGTGALFLGVLVGISLSNFTLFR